MQLGDRDIPPSLQRAGSTKLSSTTLREEEDPRCKFISLTHLLTGDFLRECLKDLKRDRVLGIDGVKVEEYEVNKEINNKIFSWL
jgi:hypothetical protein